LNDNAVNNTDSIKKVEKLKTELEQIKKDNVYISALAETLKNDNETTNTNNNKIISDIKTQISNINEKMMGIIEYNTALPDEIQRMFYAELTKIEDARKNDDSLVEPTRSVEQSGNDPNKKSDEPSGEQLGEQSGNDPNKKSDEPSGEPTPPGEKPGEDNPPKKSTDGVTEIKGAEISLPTDFTGRILQVGPDHEKKNIVQITVKNPTISAKDQLEHTKKQINGVVSENTTKPKDEGEGEDEDNENKDEDEQGKEKKKDEGEGEDKKKKEGEGEDKKKKEGEGDNNEGKSETKPGEGIEGNKDKVETTQGEEGKVNKEGNATQGGRKSKRIPKKKTNKKRNFTFKKKNKKGSKKK